MFDISKETVLLEWKQNDLAIVKRGSECFAVKQENLPNDVSIGDRFDYFGDISEICTECNVQKMFDSERKEYYCPECDC